MDIVIENLSKSYGKKTALNNISITIGNGMFGLLGANGAGKTTLIRILASTLYKSSGVITMDGIPIENVNKLRTLIGYLPQEFSLYPSFTVYQAMEYFCLLSKISNYKQRIIKYLEIVNLLEHKNLGVKALSGGMKRRLGIALALINEPKLLLVDEPTAGLDPEERIRFRNLLTTFSEHCTVILSTHIIGDIEDTCKKLAVIDNGSISFHGTVQQFREETKEMVWEIVCHKDKLSEISNLDNQSYILSQVPYDHTYKIRVLSKNKPYDEAVLVESRLEDSYMKMIHMK